MTEILPILYDESRNSRNPRLMAMAQNYIERQSGNKVDFAKLGWTWAAVDSNQVRGVVALAYTLDVPIFHCESPRETLQLYRRATERLIDNAAEGHGLVYVEPSQIEKWKPFLERIKAEPANRYRFPIGPITEI